jgi:hypothetical protein
MNQFIFNSYSFDPSTSSATFEYGFEDGRRFTERIIFAKGRTENTELLDRALFLAFILIGTSYYKTFPSTTISINQPLDEWQAQFFTSVYQEGLSQFAYENELTRNDLARFRVTDNHVSKKLDGYTGSGSLVLQSGGKDSLLTATLLNEANKPFTGWYLSSTKHHPQILNEATADLKTAIRTIDREGLKQAIEDGGRNSHVPITYIVQSLALIQAILLGKSDVIVSIAHEGEEPHHHIDDLAVTHQWSKTWSSEQNFAEYVSRYISSNIRIGSPLRNLSELRVAELFVQHSWKTYGHQFSSCNVANYQQGSDNSTLKWCGNCPKCANSYLLFAPFLESSELKSIFNGQDLFTKLSLERTFKGLLGIDGEPKPFECIGEIDELRLAYHKAQSRGGYGALSFSVPESSFDYMRDYPAQEWAVKMLQ